MSDWVQILITSITMCLLWQWLLPYEKLTSKVNPTSLCCLYICIQKTSLSSPSASMYCVFCCSLTIICKAQRDDNVKHLSKKVYGSNLVLRDALKHMNITGIKTMYFHVGRPLKSYRQQSAPERQRGLTKSKLKAWSLFHTVARNNCLKWL